MSTVRSLTGEYIELPDPLYAEMAISSLSSTQKAYDFYKTKFNWISFDNKGMTLHLVVGTNEIIGNLDDEDLKNLLDVMLKLSHEYYTNNGYISGSSIVLFGFTGSLSVYLSHRIK